jgi:hypothetical protein
MRFAMKFSLFSKGENLKKMFSSDEWNAPKWSHKHDGKDPKKKVFKSFFWKKKNAICEKN